MKPVYYNNHSQLAKDLHNLGFVLRDLRQHKEANNCMKRGLDERIYDDNPSISHFLNNLGSVLQDS